MPRSPEPLMGTEQDVIGARVGAFVVDYVLSFLVAMGGGFLLAILFRSEVATILGVVLTYCAYFVLLEGLYGQTIGKRLLGVVVVKRDGSPCTMGASVVRNLLRIVDGILNYVVGLVVMLITDERQRIGDLAADTVVVRTR
ncbi:RDD family protein [Halegenticoccus tardaugens]|uniref:RDD family protein n=1 Tax=Halegenticoccus tardaugens TaxID=2071624 RepID=UPI00100BEDC2|nr:RDD family protein [Halegenticoccus tardaugens]